MTNSQWVIVFVNFSHNTCFVSVEISQIFILEERKRRMSVRNSEIEINGWTTFDVPNQFEDLQKQLATGSYFVQNVLDLADINTRLQSNLRSPIEYHHLNVFI